MSELTSKTGADVAVEVKRLFGDEDGAQITDADILKWINSANRKIAQTSPVLQRTVVHDIVAGQSRYLYPSDRIQFIQNISFNGQPLKPLTYNEANEYINAAQHSATTGPEPVIWWSWGQAVNFWPIPTADAPGALTMDFIAIPRDLTVITDPLPLPDRFFEAILEHVMVRAHLLDENYDAANMAKQDYQQTITTLSDQENRLHSATYPTITVRDEDAW